MFAKIVNGIVEKYPYNTKEDYPNSGFPKGEDYPEFDVFWVHRIEANFDSQTHKAVESIPAFNTELQRWEQAWNILSLTEEELFLKRHNPSQFMQQMFGNAGFKAWVGQFPVIDQMVFFDAATNAKIDDNWAVVQQMYDGFKEAIAPSAEQISAWGEIAYNNGITFVF